MTKYVYLFEEGNANMKELLGGKGANLCEMTNIGLPVPPGFVISTSACKEFYQQDRRFPPGMEAEVHNGISILEQKTGRRFGDPASPLLVSVRSGAVFSMPGMMDTVLNLGLNDQTVAGIAQATADERFAMDCYRRFIHMFGDVVMGVDHDKFEAILHDRKAQTQAKYDYELGAQDWRQIITSYKELIQKETGQMFPQDVNEQLLMAIHAVFNSWNNNRAIVYRKINRIPDELGTAVNIQTMVFGNLGEDCGTGVAFTRSPATGENKLYGEYLINAQGEDVVAGIRTPQQIEALANQMPAIYQQFKGICTLLERHYRDMQDIEFTIERGRLYILQTRNGKRTAHAAIKIAVDMVNENLISKEEAITKVDAHQLGQLLHPRIDPNARPGIIATGLAASPGAASGNVVFDSDIAEKLGNQGKKVILVRTETTPDDIHGIVAAQGILTSRGGMTSHAAVVARGMGKPCVSGCEAIKINIDQGFFRINDTIIREKDAITIDGSSGQVMFGEVPTIEPELSGEFKEILDWADQIRVLDVRANADTPEDAAKAREFGASGIGLVRTEHMFMGQERLPVMQKMIMSQTREQRQQYLEKLLPFQQHDFYGILKAMQNLPVTIRLLDPPLHEFLPNARELIAEIARIRATGDNQEELASKEKLLHIVESLSEANPMLGHRGCRLGITFPEVYSMQALAIFLAAVRLIQEGHRVLPEVEIPLVTDLNEFIVLKDLVQQVAVEVQKETGIQIPYRIGTMIELPRAALLADEIAKEADFISFGTNDLTQTTMGFSRDDAEGKFLKEYVDQKILPDNPFIVLDRKGVGKLISIAVKLGKSTNPNLEVGICGEHGGEPSSIEFCHMVAMNYVSCSPFRVPVARLSAAQAALKHAQIKQNQIESQTYNYPLEIYTPMNNYNYRMQEGPNF